MPLNLANLANNTRTVEVDYFGEKFSVTYKPSMITPGTEAELQGASDEERTTVLIEQLCARMTAWDLMDGNEPTPITPERLRSIPSPVLLHIMDAMQEDMRPNRRSGRR